MRIAVLSDTHVGQQLSVFPTEFLRRLLDFDAIIHCGDYTASETVDMLNEASSSFFGVRGNMDDEKIRNHLPEEIIIELGGIKVAVTHGWGAPNGLAEKVLEKIREKYPTKKPDIILFGHTHIPSNQTIDGIRVINPGAVSGNVNSVSGTWGVLEIENGEVKWHLEQIPQAGYY